ncbi:MAG: tryptophan 7-halogenase [Xanthomonadales bacterium]|nr:tryptophan 7-halogenase [Xanthomonadales bacterium]
MTSTARCDVAIMGGGLAGLGLALQLRGRFPDLDIRVLERRTHPLPAAAHKVGESTVEIGAHWLADTLGLRGHLDAEHIRKFGFRFFWSEGRRDLHGVTELGVRKVLPVPTWQIDRGILENHMAIEARRRGVVVEEGAVVRGFDLGEDDADHAVRYQHAGEDKALSARWLVDASGRAGLVKRKLGLAQDNTHNANAVWFRLDARLELDAWCQDPAWQGACEPPERWRSTNHLVGEGYWVWLIPLSSGAHSVGIVCDAERHPLEGMNSFEKALDWLRRHQPLVADHVEANRDTLMDFLFFRNFSYGCRQVFSGDRWALTGEAGVFLDPFYSPGSDFIAIANAYIAALIGHDRAGDRLAPYARLYEQLYFSFYENTLSLYQDQYPLFGNATVMPVKVIWDYAYYWGVLCVLVFQDRLTDIALLGDVRGELERAAALNREMQAVLRDWHRRDGGDNPARMLDQGGLDWFHAMNARLHEPLDDAGVRQRLRDNLALLETLAARIRHQAGVAATPLPLAAAALDLFDHAA